MIKGNAIIGQSGGPTSAINATLAGILHSAENSSHIVEVFGMRNGIEGLLKEDIFKIRPLSEDEIFALSCTPSAVLGSCRKKLPDPYGDDTEEYEKIFSFFLRYDIRYFFYIGGNDSMDAVKKLTEYSKKTNYEMVFMGVPKTIDNDLEKTDHTPGFGSAAKYVATVMQEITCDCAVYTVKAVTIVEVMGRDAGWLTAAAGLPRLIGEKTADLIYLPEIPFDEDRFIEDIKTLFSEKPNVVVAVSEGIKTAEGEYVGARAQSGVTDIFGHKYLAGTAKYLERLVRERLGCKVRSVELNIPQRCSAHCLSKRDIDESFGIGKAAVSFSTRAATNDGYVTVLKRREGETYRIEYDCVPISEVANLVKTVPVEMINEEKNNVKDELLEYLLPLIEGEISLPREKGLPKHFKF